MSRKRKKICTTLNYIEHFLNLDSAITGCISISAFCSSPGIPLRISVGSVGSMGSGWHASVGGVGGVLAWVAC